MGYPSYAASGWTELADLVTDELARARKKFPKPDFLVTALAEESGEAIRASLEVLYSTRLGGGQKARAALVKEIVQTMAMCVRLFQEGDPIHKIAPLG